MIWLLTLFKIKAEYRNITRLADNASEMGLK